MDERAEPRMVEVERVAELAVRQVGMGDRQGSGLEPSRQPDTRAQDLDEIVRAAKHERAPRHLHGERDADAVADIFLEARRAGEALGGMDDLREAVAPGIE